MGNSWRMRCIHDAGCRLLYTVGKVYKVESGAFLLDNGVPSAVYDSFQDLCAGSITKWELVEDEMTTQEKIAKAEAKIEKWKKSWMKLKQQNQNLRTYKRRFSIS